MEDFAMGIVYVVVGIVGVIVLGIVACCAQWAVFILLGKVAETVFFGWKPGLPLMRNHHSRVVSGKGQDDPIDGAQDPPRPVRR